MLSPWLFRTQRGRGSPFGPPSRVPVLPGTDQLIAGVCHWSEEPPTQGLSPWAWVPSRENPTIGRAERAFSIGGAKPFCRISSRPSPFYALAVRCALAKPGRVIAELVCRERSLDLRGLEWFGFIP